MIEITTPVGRLVGGHPMDPRQQQDDRGQPKVDNQGQPVTASYIGLAIPKGQEQHWNQTEWGAAIWNAGVADWPNGEYNAPSFAWKITDGDSQIPNKKGKKPCDREGYPGHWIINAQTSLPIKCYHAGRYAPEQQIQNKAEIKPGDYCRAVLIVKGNNPSQSPGVYVNPSLFELVRAGIAIQLDSGPTAAEAFGSHPAPTLPPNAQIDPGVAAPAPGAAAPAPTAPAPGAAAPAPTAPAPGAAAPAPAAPAPVVSYLVNGQPFSREALLAAGWTEAAIGALPTA